MQIFYVETKKMSDTVDTCQVCCETLPPTKRSECGACRWICCRGCVQRYLLETDDDANCMSCHLEFTRSTLLAMTSKAFANGPYKRHREHVLEQREQSMLGSDAPYVTQELQRRENAELFVRMQQYRWRLKRKLVETDGQMRDLQQQMRPPLQEDRRQFMHRCAVRGCRGFLSSAWKCTVCAHYVCSECNADKGTLKDAAHECNEAERQTMVLVKTDSRKCPGCAQYIFKISGCDQMWCTSCHTAFSWNTGRRVNDVLHNPHFYAWQHSQLALGQTVGRALGDIPCGGMPTVTELSGVATAVAAARGGSVRLRTVPIMLLHRLIIHMDQTERPRFHTEIQAANNRDLRLRYTLNELTLEKMKTMLQQREKSSAKRREIGLILTMLYDTSSDIFRQLVVSAARPTAGSGHTVGLATAAKQQIEALVAYTNRALKELSAQYSCVVPHIDSAKYEIGHFRWSAKSIASCDTNAVSPPAG